MYIYICFINERKLIFIYFKCTYLKVLQTNSCELYFPDLYFTCLIILFQFEWKSKSIGSIRVLNSNCYVGVGYIIVSAAYS